MTHLSRERLVIWRDRPAEAERAEVQSHLAQCAACAALYAELVRVRPVDAAPARFDPADFLARGRALGPSAGTVVATSEERSQVVGLLRQLERLVAGSPARVRLAFAVQFAVILVLAATLLMSRRQEAVFSTLSDGDHAASGPRITVIFTPSASVDAVRNVLRDVHATIVSGPSAIGVYAIEIEGTTDSESDIEVVLRKLRSNPAVVQFAERQP